jgi:hypothetical protein
MGSSHRTRRRAALWVGALTLCVPVATGCSAQAAPSPHTAASASPGGGLEIPRNPYGPFPYANIVQKQAFQAFLECAADQGVQYRGPFADSQGKGVLFGPAPGETVSKADRLRVSEHCPQMIVGVFATPSDGGFNSALFEKMATRFARCVRSHDEAGFPVPHFSSDDPYTALEQLSFDWESQRFVHAVNACMEPLRRYVFST